MFQSQKSKNRESIPGKKSSSGQARLDAYDNPTDKDIYNKMTKYFTINVKNELCDICSAHYGTEMYITIYSDKDILFFEQVMSKYSDDYFSIGEW